MSFSRSLRVADLWSREAKVHSDSERSMVRSVDEPIRSVPRFSLGKTNRARNGPTMILRRFRKVGVLNCNYHNLRSVLPPPLAKHTQHTASVQCQMCPFPNPGSSRVSRTDSKFGLLRQIQRVDVTESCHDNVLALSRDHRRNRPSNMPYAHFNVRADRL